MNTENSSTVKLMIKAGMVPPSVLQQLVRWKLLPEDYDGPDGPSRDAEATWTPEDFVEHLRTALVEDGSEIRETSIDSFGHFAEAYLRWPDHSHTEVSNALVDSLGRVVLPAKYDATQLTKIGLDGGEQREVVRFEPRYRGDQHVAWVCYLAAPEGDQS